MSDIFESNPQVCRRKSYKFIKRLSYITTSTILYHRPHSQECMFLDIKLDEFKIPFLKHDMFTTYIINKMFVAFKKIKMHKLEQMIIELRNSQTLETVEVYTLKISYKNTEDEDTENSDLNDIIALWHDPGLPIHILNEVKCLIVSIEEVATQLPIPPFNQLDVEIFLLDGENDIPTFNFATTPSKMELGNVSTLYHSFSLELTYLDVTSKFATLKKASKKLDKKKKKKKKKKENHCCSVCNYISEDNWKLKRHIMRKHTGEKPFRCSNCNFCNADSWKVKNHICKKHIPSTSTENQKPEAHIQTRNKCSNQT